MLHRASWLALLAAACLLCTSACFAGPAYTSSEEAAAADEDFAYQGEYQGKLSEAGEEEIISMQLVAQGEGAFLCKFYTGGLPGEEGSQLVREFHLTREGNVFTTEEKPGRLEVVEGVLSAYDPEGEKEFAIQKIHRESPTLGALPLEGAVVLFDGANLDHWLQDARMTDDGLLMEGCTTSDQFQSHQLHLEFLLPYMPSDEGQARANSGCYVQGRYEIQILDSFGLDGLENECGGIYNLDAPAVNMCFPPLSWQTYDIEFHAAQYDEAGELVAHPRMTVKHNGVVIHDDLELTEGTPGGTGEPAATPGPLYLQNHGNPVRFRNVWALPLEE